VVPHGATGIAQNDSHDSLAIHFGVWRAILGCQGFGGQNNQNTKCYMFFLTIYIICLVSFLPIFGVLGGLTMLIPWKLDPEPNDT
jgi:hypothetical protein